MKQFIRRFANRFFKIETIVIIYFFVFWTLNGIEKFFHPKHPPGYTCVVEVEDYDGWKGVWTVFTSGRKVLSGGIGINRECQFTRYYQKLGWSESLVKPTLYFAGFTEITLGMLFLYLFWRELFSEQRVCHESYTLAFIGSFLVFLGLSALDILVGDRTELWEHGSYISLILVSYRLYFDDRFRKPVPQNGKHDIIVNSMKSVS